MPAVAPSSRDFQGARAAFRCAGRKVLHDPAAHALHEERIRAAVAMPGNEALQAALVDMLHACAPEPARLSELISDPEVALRLAPHVLETLGSMVHAGQALPRVNRWATRWCVLATPSLDVPRRALLCGTDDSRTLATQVLKAMQEGDKTVENEFLDHCEGTFDTLAFMLVRRDLTRRGAALNPRWEQVATVLEGARK